MTTLAELLNDRCTPRSGAGQRIDTERARELVAVLPGWELAEDGIAKAYRFRNYEETLAFVNAIARLAQHEDHHPDISFGYNRCRVAYSTHSVGGLSMNDFICAAKVDMLTDGLKS